MAGHCKLESNAKAMQGRVAAADETKRRRGGANSTVLVVVLARLERDVVAEPLRLFMRVGVTADIDEERGVVDDRPPFFVEPDAVTQAQRDHALTQHVLHRLSETEVDSERQGRHELRQAHPSRLRGRCHAATISAVGSRSALPAAQDEYGAGCEQTELVGPPY